MPITKDQVLAVNPTMSDAQAAAHAEITTAMEDVIKLLKELPPDQRTPLMQQANNLLSTYVLFADHIAATRAAQA